MESIISGWNKEQRLGINATKNNMPGKMQYNHQSVNEITQMRDNKEYKRLGIKEIEDKLYKYT